MSKKMFYSAFYNRLFYMVTPFKGCNKALKIAHFCGFLRFISLLIPFAFLYFDM